MSKRSLRQWLPERIEQLHFSLARPDVIAPLAILGLITGVVAGVVMVAFRLLLVWPDALFGIDLESFELIDAWLRLLLPTLGGGLLGWWFHRLSPADQQVGVIHVLNCLAHHDGLLPLKNAGIQLVAASVSIFSGHSVGREGPSIHIGAACGSWLGQQLRLSANSIRVLVACGTAGAIAAAFNTPLAGVVFTLEVLLIEYTLAGFTPIILAAVSATAVARSVFGSQPVFAVPAIELGSLLDLLYIVAMGAILGILAAVFIRLLLTLTRRVATILIWQRMLAAGFLTGLLGLFVPEALGIGYDTVNAVLLGQLAGITLIILLLGKIAATVICLGAGIPGGVIGPTLVIGALAGGVMGQSIDFLAGTTTPVGFYAMLGMAAMMAATLNAPLAGLTALLELTYNSHIILPGMIAVTAATLTAQHALRTPSLFLQLLRIRGIEYRELDPVSKFLQRLGVATAMDRRIRLVEEKLSGDAYASIAANPPTWLLLRSSQSQPLAIFTAELLRYVDTQFTGTPVTLDLTAIPLRRLPCEPLSSQATLLSALKKMDAREVEALYVISAHTGRVLGLITRQDIERSYRFAYKSK